MKSLMPCLFILFSLVFQGLANPVAEIRTLYAKAQKMKLVEQKYEVTDDEAEESILVTQFVKKANTSPVKVVTETSMGDHGGQTVEIYYGENDLVRFIFQTESYWSFDGSTADQSDTIDTVNELRIYFDAKGKAIQALQKSYKIKSGQKPTPPANKKVPFDSFAAERIRLSANEFVRSLTKERAKEAAQGMNQALYFYDEPNPQAEPKQWTAAPIPKGADKFPANHDPFQSAVSLIKKSGLPYVEEHDGALEIRAIHRYPGDFSVSTIITVDRLADDSTQSVRFRLDFRKNPDGSEHVSFFGWQKRKAENTGYQGRRNGWEKG